MFRPLAHRLMFVCVGCFLTFAALARFDGPSQRLPLVHADFPVCITVKPGPLKTPQHPVLNRHISEIV